MTPTELKEQVEFSVNGERVAMFDLNTRMSETDPKNSLELQTPPMHIKAGPQRVTAAFVQRLDGPVDDLLMPLENTLADVSITLRRHDAAAHAGLHGAGPVRRDRRVGHAEPAADLLVPADHRRRRRIVRGRDRQGLSTQAFRGAPTRGRPAGRDEVLRAGPREGRLRGRHPPGGAVNPDEPALPVPARAAAAGVAAATAYRVADEDLASRLSFFLWGTVPDAELLQRRQRRVAQDAGRRRQAGPPHAGRQALGALATRFASQWLRLQDLDKIFPDYLLYPQYDDTLAQAMKRETELFFDSIVREDRSVLDLLTADYSFVNERLARHYGIPNVTGSEFRA